MLLLTHAPKPANHQQQQGPFLRHKTDTEATPGGSRGRRGKGKWESKAPWSSALDGRVCAARRRPPAPARATQVRRIDGAPAPRAPARRRARRARRRRQRWRPANGRLLRVQGQPVQGTRRRAARGLVRAAAPRRACLVQAAAPLRACLVRAAEPRRAVRRRLVPSATGGAHGQVDTTVVVDLILFGFLCARFRVGYSLCARVRACACVCARAWGGTCLRARVPVCMGVARACRTRRKPHATLSAAARDAFYRANALDVELFEHAQRELTRKARRRARINRERERRRVRADARGSGRRP